MLIDPRLAQAFVAVADAGSFVAAADRLHIGQSGLSSQIKRLERLVGVPLFERTSRSVRITDAGRRLYPAALDLLASAERFADAARSDQDSQVVTFAIAENGVNPIAIALLDALRKAVTDVDLELIRASLDRQLESLHHDVDALIGRPPYGAPLAGHLRRATIGSDPLVAVVAEDHPLGDRTTASELLALSRIVHGGAPSEWSQVSDLLVLPTPGDGSDVVAADSYRTACAQVALSQRCCVMPESFATSYRFDRIRTVEIEDAPVMQVELVTGRDEQHEIVRELLATISAIDELDDLRRPVLARTAT